MLVVNASFSNPNASSPIVITAMVNGSDAACGGVAADLAAANFSLFLEVRRVCGLRRTPLAHVLRCLRPAPAVRRRCVPA